MRRLEESIEILEDYLEKTYDVDILYELGEGNTFSSDENYSEKLITINTRHKPKIRLYCMLHEAGHAILRTSKEKHCSRFSNLLKKKQTIAHRVDVVREEIIAWEEGFDLSVKLKMGLDRQDWNNYSKKHIFDYIRWSFDPKEYMKTIYS